MLENDSRRNVWRIAWDRSEYRGNRSVLEMNLWE